MKRLRNLAVTAKIIVVVVVSTVVLATYAAVSLQTLSEAKVGGPRFDAIQQYNDIIADILPPPEYVVETNMDVLAMLGPAQGGDAAEIDRLVAEVARLHGEYDLRHQYWTEELAPGELREVLLVDSYEPAVRYFALVQDEYIPLIRAGQVEAARTLAYGEIQETYREHRAAIDREVTLATAAGVEERASTAQFVERRTWLLLVLLVLALIATAGLSLLVGRTITQPLNRLRSRLDHIADGDGDLTQRLDRGYDDEIGQTARAFNRFVARIQTMVTEMATTADALAAAAEELSAVSTQMRAGATTMANRTEELSVSIREIAHNAVETTTVTHFAVESSTEASLQMARLEERSNDIAGVVEVIRRIASQTNLLALNATIEAARAGDAGKGFKVVATEVKHLATRTAGATGEISERLAAVLEDVEMAASNIAGVTDLVGSIAEGQASVSAAVGQQQTTTAIIGEDAHHAADAAADTDKAALELARLAASLQTLVRQFRFRADSPAEDAPEAPEVPTLAELPTRPTWDAVAYGAPDEAEPDTALI